ncbi:MAG: YfiR family protein [Verrucomicrobiae bacterium]|nr:YfiR family protein [Verrucomicrobiae bacterium]
MSWRRHKAHWFGPAPRRSGWWLLLSLSAFFSLAAESELPQPTEAELKAAVVYQITRFVEWPAPPPTNAPLVIGVVGEGPLIAALEQLANAAPASLGRALTIQKLPPSLSRTNAAKCHVVVIGEQVPERAMTTMLADLDGQGILTVSALPDFCRKGGMVGLNLSDRRVQIEINLNACERARLRPSSRLLRQAKIVAGPTPPSR